MKRGFVRLWLFASALWFTGCALILAFHIFVEPACYKLFTASFINPLPEDKRAIVQEIQQKLVEKPLCDDIQPYLLLTLERLAKEGVATQVSIQWQETRGWSGDTRSSIGILDGKEITVVEIQKEVRDAVRKDRFQANIWLMYIALAVPIPILLIGGGIFWVVSGFKPK